MTYEEFCEEEEAVHSGSAIQLTSCYLCPEGSPLRGILKRTCPPSPDPYEVQHLSCGHAII